MQFCPQAAPRLLRGAARAYFLRRVCYCVTFLIFVCCTSMANQRDRVEELEAEVFALRTQLLDSDEQLSVVQKKVSNACT